jgi:hypothetical protein
MTIHRLPVLERQVVLEFGCANCQAAVRPARFQLLRGAPPALAAIFGALSGQLRSIDHGKRLAALRFQASLRRTWHLQPSSTKPSHLSAT